MRMLRLKSLEHYEGLQTNRWGIRELDPAEVEGLEDGEFGRGFSVRAVETSFPSPWLME